MNKKIIALAVAAAAFGTQASAAELYNNSGTTFSVGGHLTAAIQGSEADDPQVESVSPRINIGATHEIGNGFTVDAKGEWALNMLEGGEESFTTRLGYLGMTHDTLGRAVAGTQWTPYADIVLVADMPIAFANDFAYDNHYNLGTGRGEQMLSYRNSFEAGSLDINLGAAWQGKNVDGSTTYDDRVQMSLSADIADFTLGYAFTTGEVSDQADDSESQVISAKYGAYGKGLYVAATYASNDYMNSFKNEVLEETKAYEAIIAYALPNSLNLSVNFEQVEDEEADETIYSQMALQAEYNITSKFVAFAGYQIDLGNDKDVEEENKYSAGVRYYL